MPKTPDAKRRVANPLALAVWPADDRTQCTPTNSAGGCKETGMDRSVKFNRGSLYMVVEQLKKPGSSRSGNGARLATSRTNRLRPHR